MADPLPTIPEACQPATLDDAACKEFIDVISMRLDAPKQTTFDYAGLDEDGIYRLQVQVHFWEGSSRLAFERADCWETERTSMHGPWGTCMFSIVAEVDPVPEAPHMMAAGLIILALFARRRGLSRAR